MISESYALYECGASIVPKSKTFPNLTFGNLYGFPHKQNWYNHCYWLNSISSLSSFLVFLKWTQSSNLIFRWFSWQPIPVLRCFPKVIPFNIGKLSSLISSLRKIGFRKSVSLGREKKQIYIFKYKTYKAKYWGQRDRIVGNVLFLYVIDLDSMTGTFDCGT